MSDEIYSKIVEELRALVPLKVWGEPITPDTEVYGDLKIYGDVLFDFLMWIKNEFGVQVTVAGGKYAPSEKPFFWLVDSLRRAIGSGNRNYKSLKVRDIVQAIDACGRQFD